MNYHDITKEDMKNGDGLRTVLWVAGCGHHCKGCQNPVTWDPNGGIPFDAAAMDELMESLFPDYISGLTLSGGDPLMWCHLEEVLQVIREVKKTYPDKTIWIYTGYTFEELVPFLPPTDDAPDMEKNSDPIIMKILGHTDVLVDGPYVEGLRDVSLMWRGSSNQRVIDVQKSLAGDPEAEPVLWCD